MSLIAGVTSFFVGAGLIGHAGYEYPDAEREDPLALDLLYVKVAMGVTGLAMGAILIDPRLISSNSGDLMQSHSDGPVVQPHSNKPVVEQKPLAFLHFAERENPPFTVDKTGRMWDDYELNQLAELLNEAGKDSVLGRTFVAFTNSVGVFPGDYLDGHSDPRNHLFFRREFYGYSSIEEEVSEVSLKLLQKRSSSIFDIKGMQAGDDIKGIQAKHLLARPAWGIDNWRRPFVTGAYLNVSGQACTTTIFPATRESSNELKACDSCKQPRCGDIAWGDSGESEDQRVKGPVQGLVWKPVPGGENKPLSFLYFAAGENPPFTVDKTWLLWDAYKLNLLAELLNEAGSDSVLGRTFVAFSNSVGVFPSDLHKDPWNRLEIRSEFYGFSSMKERWQSKRPDSPDIKGIQAKDLPARPAWGIDLWDRLFITGAYLNVSGQACTTTIFPATRKSGNELRACDSCKQPRCGDIAWGDSGESEDQRVKGPVQGFVWKPVPDDENKPPLTLA